MWGHIGSFIEWHSLLSTSSPHISGSGGVFYIFDLSNVLLYDKQAISSIWFNKSPFPLPAYVVDIGCFKINTPFSTQEVFVVDAVIGYQDVTSSSTFDGENVTTNVHWTGTVSDYLVTFDGGYQMILLPGGMYMGCPCDVAKSVAESKSFHLEFCWLETPDKRQRLVRTYDMQGLAVSSTYFVETKL